MEVSRLHLSDSLWEKVENGIERFAGDAFELSDWMARNPEVSGEEFEASRRHASFLQKVGYDVTIPFMDIPTAFCAKKETSRGARVCLMFEYDALPGIGHGCGHNLSGAMSGLAAAGLFNAMDELPGELVLLGTPAEETSGAKVPLAEKGFFDGMDLAMMVHCSDRDTYVGFQSLALEAVEFRFSGQPAHASGEPWSGRNALNGVQLFFHGIDMLRQHVRPEVRMHGVIHEGGLAPNIVPEHASARFYFRAPQRSLLDQVLERARKCALGAALATETEVSWSNFEYSFDDMLRNLSAERAAEEIFQRLGVFPVPAPGASGSSDMGNVSHRCPALQPKLAITDRTMALHTHEFARATTAKRAHQALVVGARMLARTALTVFLDAEIRGRIQEDFKKEKERAIPAPGADS